MVPRRFVILSSFECSVAHVVEANGAPSTAGAFRDCLVLCWLQHSFQFLEAVPTALGHAIVRDDAMHAMRNKMGKTMP